MEKDYSRSCPEQFEAEFLKGFSDGQTLYGLKKILSQRAAELESTYKEIDWLEHAIADKSELMIADGLKRESAINGEKRKWHNINNNKLSFTIPYLN